MMKKWWQRWRKMKGWKKVVSWVVIVAVLLATVPVMTFKVGCGLVADVPEGFMVTVGQTEAPEGVADYLRPEDSTYLTIPEWYTVFSYQEYAAFIAEHKQSEFPYFRAVGQFWYSYCNAYEVVKDDYPTNYGNHLMLSVIGVSYTMEYGLKGIYENIVGRLTEWIGGDDTAEDEFARRVAKEYGEFIPFDPWYAFPFGENFVAVWSDVPFLGPDFVRKFERKLQISAAQGFQAIYAWLIRAGTGAVYGAPDEKVYMRVMRDGEVEVAELPHYQGFTDGAPVLASEGVDFIDIAGNDEIVVSVIAADEWDGELPAEKVFDMEVLSRPENERLLLKVMVEDLGDLLRQIEKDQQLELEHIFDY